MHVLCDGFGWGQEHVVKRGRIFERCKMRTGPEGDQKSIWIRVIWTMTRASVRTEVVAQDIVLARYYSHSFYK